MCGLLFSNDSSVTDELFSSALGLMNHRGPDFSSVSKHIGTRMGHLRLKIIDLDDRSNQPFYSSDGRHCIIFNGEIYNHRELTRTYSLPKRTNGDTEVILELFKRLGPSSVKLLDGMFAFIIFDTQTGSTFAARDPLGVKPLYWSNTPGGTLFASEIAPLTRLVSNLVVDEFAMRQYRKLRCFFNGRTPFRGIYMFPAGTYSEDGKLTKYWSLPEDRKPPPEDDELESLIQHAVTSRCLADVSVGCYLSGGLDSSVVTLLSGVEHTWTVGFTAHNEFSYAQEVAELLHTSHHEILIEHDEFPTLASELIKTRFEPLSVPNEVLVYKMTKEVKKHNTVVLSGEGADELFFGYDRIFRWASVAKEFDIKTFDALYSYGKHKDDDVVYDALQPFMHLLEPIDIVAAFFQAAHLHGLLRRLDNSTMRCSVEARVPFADYIPLISRMAGVPISYKMAGGVVKAPLKRLYAKRLPDGVIKRPKIGFPVPLNEIVFPGVVDKSGYSAWMEFCENEFRAHCL